MDGYAMKVAHVNLAEVPTMDARTRCKASSRILSSSGLLQLQRIRIVFPRRQAAERLSAATLEDVTPIAII